MKTLVDLVDRLEQDQTQPEAVLRRRDRPLGLELSVLSSQPRAQLSAWLERIAAAPAPTLGGRVAAALRLGLLALVVAGLLLGWLTAAAVFFYTGAHPVNIIHALAVFVGLQGVLLLVTLLALLPEGVLHAIPGLQALREAFRLFSPGRLPGLLVRWLPARYREATASFLGNSASHRALYGRVEKWLIIRSGQAFGVAFNLGALAGSLYLVVFSDLAFGWSTTLQLASIDLKTLTDGLSWPWSWLFPQGRPSLELIEATRYFRFQAGTLPGLAGSGPATLGEWWPFLLLCLLVYGLLPRLLTLTLATLRLRRACRQAMLHLPGVPAVLERLNSQWVETRADQPESPLDLPLEPGRQSSQAANLRGKAVAVIDWGATGLQHEPVGAWLEQDLGASLADFQAAGGACSIGHDRKLLQDLAKGRCGGVLLLVKSWEPPMAEFKDFLQELRRGLDRELPLAVVPVGLDSSAAPLPPVAELAAVWATMVKQLGDPWTFLLLPQPRERQ